MRTLISVHLAEESRARADRAYLDFRRPARAARGIEPSEALSSMLTPAVTSRR